MSANKKRKPAKDRRSAAEVFWYRVDQFSPLLCRLLARHKRGLPLTDEEIAAFGGNTLTPYDVRCIAELESWDDVRLRDMRAFLRGCGLDFCDRESMHRVTEYLKMKKNRFQYLKKSPQWEAVFKPLLKRLTER